MSSQPSTEQQMLRDSIIRWVDAQARSASPADRWRQMADFGWLAMTLPEAHGGLGQGLSEACILAEALGAGPITDPWLPVIAQAAPLIARTADAAQRERWLAPMASGESLIVPAILERQAASGGWRPTAFATRARRTAGGWQLDGIKHLVPGGDRADAWLVAAHLDTAVNGKGSMGVFIVPRQAAGVSATPLETVDGSGACRLVLAAVTLDAGAHLAACTLADLDLASDEALVLACAESVGAMDTLRRTTADYLRTRVQFGRPLAANQALRHRMADVSVACEEARSMTHAAVLAFADPAVQADSLARARVAAGARAKVGALARRVCEEAIQLHGGMGVTEELTVGIFLKRQLALDAMFGPPEWHLRRHAQLRADIAARNAGKSRQSTQAEVAK